MWELLDSKLVRVVRAIDEYWTTLSLYCDGERFVAILGNAWVEDEENWCLETDCPIEAAEFFYNF